MGGDDRNLPLLPSQRAANAQLTPHTWPQEEVFGEPIRAVALHPSGLLACVAVASRVCLVSLLESGTGFLKDLPIKNCEALAFNREGGLLAAAHGITVSVFSTWTAELIASLR